MLREALVACLPWLAALAVSVAALWLLVRLGGGGWRPPRLAVLHADQRGAVQSLSFVLTVPLFVMLMMFVVQVTQLMVATIVVHYAAFAAARSAIVWIPARLEPGIEQENRISTFIGVRRAEGGLIYRVRPGSPKFEKIRSAAVLACTPIAPSRDLGQPRRSGGLGDSLQAMYQAVAPASAANLRTGPRLANKLAYADAHTAIRIEFLHKDDEPPLIRYFLGDDWYEFYFNEVGWQDPITVTVTHEFALLPGPGRLLARRVDTGRVHDRVSREMERIGPVYVYPITASATLGNEGEKSVVPYVYAWLGQ
jgi:hypothetical protein